MFPSQRDCCYFGAQLQSNYRTTIISCDMSVRLSVRPSVRPSFDSEQIGSNRTDFCEIFFLEILRKFVDTMKHAKILRSAHTVC
jgi:hypothetical protein